MLFYIGCCIVLSIWILYCYFTLDIVLLFEFIFCFSFLQWILNCSLNMDVVLPFSLEYYTTVWLWILYRMSSIPTSTLRGRGMGKHFWATTESNALIDSLLELSQNLMWRFDCGFKNGYLQQQGNKLDAKLPSCCLRDSLYF